MTDPIEMPFQLRLRVGPRNHALNGFRSPFRNRRGNFSGGKGAAHCKIQQLSAISCAKTAEPIEMPFGIWTPVGPRKHVLGGVTLAQPGEYH